MNSIKRREMGIAGAIVVLSQVITNLQSQHSITQEVKELRVDIQQVRLDRDQYFVRKTDVASVVLKIDKLSDQLIALKEQVSSFRRQMENRYSLQECDPVLTDLECKEVVSR